MEAEIKKQSNKQTVKPRLLDIRRFSTRLKFKPGTVIGLRGVLIWLASYLLWLQPLHAQTTTWKGAFENVSDMGESGSQMLNMLAVLIGSGMAIFGWIGLTSETKRQQRGVVGSLILIIVGALLIVWRVVVQTNVSQIFGEGTDVPFLDS